MRSSLVFITLCSYAQEPSQKRVSEPPYIWEVIPQHYSIKLAYPHAGFQAKPLGPKRTPEDCHFPLDVVILQDATSSFDDNIISMRETQLDLIYSGITGAHPESRFGVVSFKDKPIVPLGNRDDYCTRFDTMLTGNLTAVKEGYSKIVSYGGYDAPENQFGTLYNVIASNTVGWSQEKNATKLVVISTDAGPHFGGDSHTGLVPVFDPNFSQDQNMTNCISRYYPTPAQMRAEIQRANVYVASLIYDGDWANNWPTKSWKSFNEYIGQSDDFVAEQAPDSKDFWSKLAKMIENIETIECHRNHTTTTTTTTTAATTRPTTVPRTTETVTTSQRVTTTPGTPQTTIIPTTSQRVTTTPGTPQTTIIPTTSTTKGCVCPCDDCGCCPEVLIKLQHRPLNMHLDVAN